MKSFKSLLNYLYVVFIFSFFIVFLLFLFKTPSLDRDWNLDQKILPKIYFYWDSINIKNIRNFQYNSTSEYRVLYYDKTYDLNNIESLYYIIEPFSNFDWPAHTMMSFGFSDGSYLTISAEIRKEVWESFSAIKWLLKQYELVYMVWDENDLVKLRANYRKDEVIMYPIKTSKENIKNIFVSMLKRADYLTKNPEFYNTITNNCTTSILKHANEIRQSTNKSKIWWSIYTFLPSRSDTVVYDLWLIDTSMTLEQAREYYKINDLSENFWDHIEYSKFIRKERK